MVRTCWRELIKEEMDARKDSLSNVESMAPVEGPWLDVKFDSGYGGSEGAPFTVWTKSRVYFPGVYDGSEWCASVTRNPDGNSTRHVGNE